MNFKMFMFSFCLALPVISKCMELSMGSGNDRKLKGSKRALMWPQVLHFTWDLSCPWKRSTTIERFLRKWFSQACERETRRCPQGEKMTFHQCVHIGSFKSAELMYWAWQGLKNRSFDTNLCGYFMIWPSITILELHVWFLVHAIQVFMKPIQEKCQELLGVLLLEAIESRCILCYCPLQKWHKNFNVNIWVWCS